MDEVLKGVLERADVMEVRHLVEREEAIRKVMAETGESRVIVAEMYDALDSMHQEAVLDLTDGEPTTLQAGLQKYADTIELWDDIIPRDRVLADLTALLRYPWPGLARREDLQLEIVHEDDEHVEFRLGDYVVTGSNHDEIGNAGMSFAEELARNLHRAIMARL